MRGTVYQKIDDVSGWYHTVAFKKNIYEYYKNGTLFGTVRKGGFYESDGVWNDKDIWHARIVGYIGCENKKDFQTVTDAKAWILKEIQERDSSTRINLVSLISVNKNDDRPE